MQLVKVQYQNQIFAGVLVGDLVHLDEQSATSPTPILDFLDSDNLLDKLTHTAANNPAVPSETINLLAPIDRQEVWAAGVTYIRSKSARMEESETAASCYDRVYDADRPEIFFKATPNRVIGPGGNLRIRVDSKWNVPEPEITLAINSRKEIVGFTIGNDMSSRDIEGDNPLYLPQAKVYDACCGLGPAITPTEKMPTKSDLGVELSIYRESGKVFSGKTDASQLAREFDELVQWLGRDNSFPDGAFLLTGTGIVPDSDFTLLPGDDIQINIDGIGRLQNGVVQG